VRRLISLRLVLPALALAAALLFVLAPAGAQAVSYSTQELQLARVINDYRVSLGLKPLMVSDTASDAAEKHSTDMAVHAFFSHTTLASSFFPVGANAGQRLALCDYPSHYGWGEIIAGGYSSASAVLMGWKRSSDHNEVMTNPNYKVMGIGVVHVENSKYEYYWTVDFGIAVDSTAHWVDGSASTTTTPTTTTPTTVPPPTTPSTTLPDSPSTTTTTVPATVFSDVPAGDRFYEPISQLAAAGVVCGFSDGLFRPNDPVTRSQFAKIIVSALDRHTAEIDNADRPTFADVPYWGEAYPFDFVEEAAALGIVQGYPDGTFAPEAFVTRLQLARMLVRAGGDGLAAPPPGFSCPFVDVPDYAREAIAIALYNDLLAGKTETIFDPYSTATRGQVARMVYGLTQVLGL
jgi:uncharacterized protein YkwD